MKTDSAERLYNIPWGVSSLTEQDKMFFLSARELTDYVGSYDSAPGLKATDTAQNAVGWWLRSPDSGSTGNAGLVNELGVMYSWHVDEDYAARPAFNLNRDSVLFTSAAEGGKAANGMDSGLTATGDYTGSEWKLTLLDKSRAFSISNAAINSSGNTIGFSYSNAQTGGNEYISVVIEEGGTITHYGRILQLDGTTNGASGTASLTLPADVRLGDDTKLYVFNEQYNGGENDDIKLTDYASALIEVNPTVDTTAPTLSGGSAIRDSATAATVKFTSNEAGTYYYVVDSGATAPTIDTTGAGTACASGENTISLTSLSGAGAKDIYIVAKDAVGNVSDVLTIQIPACTFTVTVNVDPPGGGTASADQSVAVEGDEIELTASPNEGYHFKEWQVTPDNVSIGDDNKFTMPAENVTVKAVFEAHNLTAHDYKAPTCTETGNSQYWECSVCKQLFSDAQGNTEITIADVTIPATGHTAGETWQHDNGSPHWKECEDCGAKVDETAHVYDNGQDDTCDVCNHKRDTYTLTVDLNNGSGSATGGKYAAGAVISIDAGTRTNYRFTGWTSSNGGDFASASSASTTFTMPANDTTITANWRYTGGGSSSGGSGGGSATYLPIIEDSDGGDTTVSPSRPSSGQTVTITPDPDKGYEVEDVTVTDRNGNEVKVTDNGDGTYSFRQPSSKVTIEATFAEIQEEPALAFTDVTERDYYYDAVLWAVENGITSGTSATTFSPDANVSRAQMVTFLWRAAGSPEPQSSVNPFTDVSSSAYYYDAVLWAVENGITSGTSGTTFSPESAVSRAQAVTFLWRSASSPIVSGGSFADVADDAYYAQAVTWAAQEGITSGTGGNNFSPDLIVSRAQAVTFLYRQHG